MHRFVAALCALPVAFALLASVAAAGDDKPPRTILRPTDVPTKELVVLVSGIHSRAEEPTFDAIIERYWRDPRYEVRILGGDAEHPYDSTGPIDVAASSLIGEIRALAPSYRAVHIVAHSMGGVVVDRAFAQGLSSKDGVRTYIALATPHDGSRAAKIAGVTLAASGNAAVEIRAALSLAHDPATPAAVELARIHASAPPAGVTRLDVRLASDAIVSGQDATTPGVDSRTLLPSSFAFIEGHGGVTRDPQVVDLVSRTIAEGRPPTDTRGLALRLATGVVSEVFDWRVGGCLLLLSAACISLSRLIRHPLALPFRPLLRRVAIARLRAAAR